MKHLFIKTLAGSGLLLMAMTASAQYQPRSMDRYQPVQDERQVMDQNHVFDQIRDDLDRIHTFTLPFTPDRNRVNIAREQVNDCQQAVNSGDYDRQTFNQTIDAIQRVVDLNHLTDQSRGNLVSDIRELSHMEARLEG